MPVRDVPDTSTAAPASAGRRRGLLIVLEGVEGAGKTTQVHRLVTWLEGRGIRVRSAREPGGTPAGEAIRGVLLDRTDLRIEPEEELLLMLAARAAFVRELVRPALDAGDVMVADRFELSTLAYQGFGRGLPIAEIRRLNRFATGDVRPDLVVVLDVPVEVGLARQRAEGKGADRIEAGGEDFLRRVAEGYRTLAAEDPAVAIVDARAPADEVQARIRELVAARMPELRDPARGSNGPADATSSTDPG